jgi:hypothetical protein
MIQTQSTISLQRIVNIAEAFADIEPVLNVAGSENHPALFIATDVMNVICGVPFPHKWNEINLPPFYTNSFQQDYALVYPAGQPVGYPASGSSLTNLAWLERGIAIDINSTSFPKAYRTVECGRQLPQATASNWNYGNGSGSGSYGCGNAICIANFFPNNTLYYGTWGDLNNGTQSIGNNPIAGSAYTQPLGTQSMPANPISQILDANGNFLVITTYGVEGATAPLAAPNSLPGVTVSGLGATTVWTVVDPWGQGIRVQPVPYQTGRVFQILLTGQAQPVRFTSLAQTLFPLPDQFEPNFRQGFIAQCYRYSADSKVRGKFKDEWQLWLASLVELRAKQDRELEENMFVPDRGIMSGSSQRGGFFRGPGYPFNY